MTEPASHRKVDFDGYADAYEKLLQDQLKFFSSDRSYFSEYKAKILRSIAPVVRSHILDFGAGVGLIIPHLRSEFPDGKVYASDISAASLAHLSKRFPDIAVVNDDDLYKHRFDIILIATVLHHVEPQLRHTLMQRLGRLLKPGGRICIFEHNPYNPITQRMVSTCPFDEDAILLPMRESIELITKSSNLELEAKGYTLFLPPRFSALSSVEGLLRWLPLGGQYFVLGRNG